MEIFSGFIQPPRVSDIRELPEVCHPSRGLRYMTDRIDWAERADASGQKKSLQSLYLRP